MTLRALVLLLTGRLLQGLDQINAVLRFDPDNQPAKELRSRIKGVIRLKEDGNALFGEKQWNAAIGKWSDALEVGSTLTGFTLHAKQVFASSTSSIACE